MFAPPPPLGRGEQPGPAELPAERFGLIGTREEIRPMHLIEPDESHPPQALGNTIQIAAVIEPYAAVDVERANTKWHPAA